MKKKVSINALKIAIDVFVVNYGFNKIDSSGMTFCSDAASFLAKNFFYLIIPVIKSGGKVCGCSACFAAAYQTIFNQYDLFSRFRQGIGSGKPCQASPNDQYV